MSYARSSEPGSDVYVYGSADGIHLHVAYNRGSAGKIPQPKPGSSEEEWMSFFDDVIPFDHPEAGQSYFFTSYSECIEKLRELRDSGVGVPDRAFSGLMSDAVGNDTYSP